MTSSGDGVLSPLEGDVPVVSTSSVIAGVSDSKPNPSPNHNMLNILGT